MKKQSEEEILKELPLFKHKIDGQVKFHEVDSFGVLHNIQYLYIFEWARTKYFEFIGLPLNNRTYTLENPVMTVRHEINYFNPIMLADYYEAYSRVVKVGKSSIQFENLLLNQEGKLLAKVHCTLVYLSVEDYKPTRISDEIREMILNVEGSQVIFSE